MSKHEFLLDRIRGEFREMPGLQLTLPQACRLWHLDRTTCTSVLDTLVQERFIRQRPDGAYIAWAPRPLQARAGLPSAGVRARGA